MKITKRLLELSLDSFCFKRAEERHNPFLFYRSKIVVLLGLVVGFGFLSPLAKMTKVEMWIGKTCGMIDGVWFGRREIHVVLRGVAWWCR